MRKLISATAFHAGKTLSEAELHPPSRRCPICYCQDEFAVVVNLQKDPRVDFVKCPNCLGISASRMPTAGALADYYANYYDRVATELVTTPRPERLAHLIADHIETKRPDGKLSILDFGGGDGTISILAAERLIGNRAAQEVDILVVDYVSGNRRPVPPGVTLRFAATLEHVEARHDIVLASAILEHVPDFRAAFDQLMRLILPGGFFYARTPYMTPLGKVLPLDLTFPAHVHDLGGHFWTRMAANAGVPVRIVKNGPSIVETVFSSHSMRTLVAHTLKMPARVLAGLGLPPYWPFYGGWQVMWVVG